MLNRLDVKITQETGSFCKVAQGNSCYTCICIYTLTKCKIIVTEGGVAV